MFPEKVPANGEGHIISLLQLNKYRG